MRLSSLTNEDRQAMAEAIRAGESVSLDLDAALNRGSRGQRNLRLDEIVPLCDSVDVTDVELAKTVAAARAPGARPGNDARITAVIPCHQGPPKGLKALLEQDVDVRILVLSNGDGPQEVEGAEVIVVPWLGHGATRAHALQYVQTEYVFFTVDDAIPLGAGCLRTLVEVLEAGGWDAAMARQIPWPDAGAVTAARLRRWTPPGERVVEAAQADHVATLYRTETLRKYPIPTVAIAEDAWWSRGRRVAYVPGAPILHSHPRNPGDLYRRNRDIHAQLVAMGQTPTVPDLGAFVRALSGVVRPTLSAGPGELLNQVAELAGQWKGGSDVTR